MDGDGGFFMTTQEKQALYRAVRQEILTCGVCGVATAKNEED